MKTAKHLIVLFFVVCTSLCASEEKQTVCLNMIIKDETDVICRCLASAKPLIDYWVIVDTGSTDGTQEMVKEFMKDIPGELHERPWKNFAHNRNEALQLAKGKGDYLLFIDADETFQYEPGFRFPNLDRDAYFLTTSFGGMNYGRLLLVRSTKNWQWRGVLHEALYMDESYLPGHLEGIINFVRSDGARSKDPLKYHKDASVLELALKEDPANTRYQFYLAQSYKCAGDLDKALVNYRKRIEMGGWDQELFWSKYQVALLLDEMKAPSDEVIKAYYEAYVSRPSRIEPLYYLANYYRRQGNVAAAYTISSLAAKIPLSQDLLFVQKWMTDYGIPIEQSVAAYWLGKFDECLKGSLKILDQKDLPENIRGQVQKNLQFAVEQLKQNRGLVVGDLK
jgi:glycosyltransferase involved in cell wall biosynthesis